MITKEEFINKVTLAESRRDYLQIVRKYILHGVPTVFEGKEDCYFDFRSKIAGYFNIGFHEVFIVGSAKLGYSYHKESVFSLNSDIDVVLVNEKLFEDFYFNICQYQYDLDKGDVNPDLNQRKKYESFLRYLIKGWMRPDMLPVQIKNRAIKNEWFEFFKSISYGKSSVGDYKVAGGLFKNYSYLEEYYIESLMKINKINNNYGKANTINTNK